MAGGGSSSGKVDYADYLKQFHQYALGWDKDLNNDDGAPTGGGILAAFEDAAAAPNPYEDAYAFDPTELLELAENGLASFQDEVQDFTPIELWQDLLPAIIQGVDDLITQDSQEVTDAVEAYSRRDATALMRSVGRFAAGMADVGAATSSAYVMGLALLENEHLQRVDKVNKDLTIMKHNDRTKLIAGELGSLMRYYAARLELLGSAAHLRGDLSRMSVVAQTERHETDLEYDAKDRMWEINLYKHIATLLASFSGGQAMTPQAEHSKSKSVLGGALAGGAIGASLISEKALEGGVWSTGVLGPIGAGLALGGLAGLLAS